MEQHTLQHLERRIFKRWKLKITTTNKEILHLIAVNHNPIEVTTSPVENQRTVEREQVEEEGPKIKDHNNRYVLSSIY